MSGPRPHRHLIVFATVMSPPGKDDCAAVRRWYSKLIADIGMKELAAPRAFYCDEPGNRGMTADVLLTTSNSALHAWDECYPGKLQFDLFSCSDLHVDTVLDALDCFDPIKTKTEWWLLDRDTGLKGLGKGRR